MNLKSYLALLIFAFLLTFKGNAQDKKQYQILRTNRSITVDGFLKEAFWEEAQTASNFTQFDPNIGNVLSNEERTEVKMAFTDDAVYVAAKLYDDPQKMLNQIRERDDFGQTDYFRLILNPNNDSQNDTHFIVFSSGTQADAIASPTLGTDFGWDSVWYSAVQRTDEGWQLEMKIPLRALRFPDQKVQTWGIQFRRFFRRQRSRYSWNPIDPSKGYEGLYHGELIGIKDLEPPLRLNLYPFTTGIAESFDNETDNELRFGLDVKYGITDNITLDATLVPDFSQARFDNNFLNLGPFEQTFTERRQFFKEGVELFTKGDLFFSRRVGNEPTGDVSTGTDEVVENIPGSVDLINAIKVSGRQKSGLGIGVFNAVTERTFASVKDTISGESRQELVEPLANYNILVADQQFNNNSSVTLINTNVTRSGDARDANVTGLLFDLVDNSNTYGINGEVKTSSIRDVANEVTGWSTFLRAGKTGGNFRYSFDHSYADDKYDINDMGLIFRNNFNNFGLDASYRIFESTEKLQTYRVNTWFNYRRLATPSEFTGINFGVRYFATTLQLDTFGFDFNFSPGRQFDYFEARTPGRFFIYENEFSIGGFISTNYNRTFAFNASLDLETLFENGRDTFRTDIEISPRVRVNDHFSLIYETSFTNRNNDRGFADLLNGEPIFGERDRQILVNSLEAAYNFNSLHALNLTFRHYWDTVTYKDNMLTLQENGRLTAETNVFQEDLDEDPDINFSQWNIDLSYSWQFTRGSFLTLLYRNQLFRNGDDSRSNYTQSLDNLFDAPALHLVSLRIQYFLDVNKALQAI